MMKFVLMMVFSYFMLFNSKGIKMYISMYYNCIFFFSLVFSFNWLSLSCSGIGVVGIMGGYFALDSCSYLMILLSIWIMGLVVMVLESVDMKLYLISSMLFIFWGFFSSLSLFGMYFFFEISLVPIFLLVIYWGPNFERLNSGIYMLMYTLFISLPFLVYIFYLYSMVGSLNLLMLIVELSLVNFSVFDYIILFSPFFIKLPIYIFHIWLPKAHVEAPVYGSMILAAVLLKLGGYGLIRMFSIFLYSSMTYNLYIFSISYIGALLVSLVTLVQIDLKELVAYSSVVHMNFLLCSMFTLTNLGILGAIIIMVGHGLCSSGLFYMVNIYYNKTHSRIMFLNKGMMNFLPGNSIWWFLLCVINFSFPLSLNFFGEVMIMGSIIMMNHYLIWGVCLISFMSSAYSLYLFSYIQHGEQNFEYKIYIMYFKDFMILFMHIFPLVFMLFSLLVFS